MATPEANISTSVHNATLNKEYLHVVRFVFHTRTNFSLHNADGSVILNVNNCIFASTHQLQLFKEIRNPVNTDNHGPINRQPTCLFNASELRSNRSSSNLGTSLADIFRILLPLAQRIGYYHTRRLPAVSPVLIARCAANTNATIRTNSGGDWRTPSSKTYTPTGRFRCVDLVGFAAERRGPHNIAVYAVVFYSKGKVFPYSFPSVEPGADPGVQAVSPQVTLSESHRRPGSRLPLLSARPAVTSVAFTKWRYL